MGALLLIPFLLIRFVLLFVLNPEAIRRAAHFAPMAGRERIAYWVYQVSNMAIFISMFFFQVKRAPAILFWVGASVYLAGTLLLVLSVVGFAVPAQGGLNQTGVYALSRNPMYVAYFMCFCGCALLLQSPVLLALVVLFQISAHWVILAEERWCIETFAEEYHRYMKRVRRYI